MLWQVDADTRPPERHADRVVAQLMRDLAQKQALVAKSMRDAFAASSRDGSPRAQQRMANRIKAAGAIHVDLKSGTRGRYRLMIEELRGWDPAEHRTICVFDPVPEKPWLVWYVTRIDGRAHDVKSVPVMFVTHHALSRAAQRFGVRTAEHIVNVTWHTWLSTVEKSKSPAWLLNPPPQGHRINLGDGVTAVLRRHETEGTLVVATFLYNGETQ